jgi:hypothetical protein
MGHSFFVPQQTVSTGRRYCRCGMGRRAGGLSKRAKGGPTNGMSNIGGNEPGGFYNASSVRVDAVDLQNDPVPYYWVRLTGQIGETRQTLYAAVLEDGRIIRPTTVSGPAEAKRVAHRKAH